MYDVVIIGAGIIGAMTARALSKYQVRICVLEKENDVAMGATKANSAIVHAGFDAREGSLKAKLNVQGAKQMESICRELGVSYRKNGSLVLGFDEEDRQMLLTLLARGKANGVESLALIEGETLRLLEPNVSEKAICALHAPTAGIVCPYELTVAAIGNAMDHGARLKCNFQVDRIREIPEGYRIFSREDFVEARFVVNCAGVDSDSVARLIGDDSFRIHPRRGEYLLLDRSCGNLVSHTVFQTPSKLGKGVLITPTVDGNLLIGPTAEDQTDKENKNTTEEGLKNLMEKAEKSISHLPWDQTITSFCGLRAVGSTGDFILTSPKQGWVHAAGIESPGLSASPAIADTIVELLCQQGLDLVKNEAYSPIRESVRRFLNMTMEEKNRLIRKDPAYGRIVCRCEGITEGEILEAIRRNPKATDLDGIKRRTRAQMGRCQGSFCGPYITEILARSLQIPMESVTKFGGGSKILSEKTKGGGNE